MDKSTLLNIKLVNNTGSAIRTEIEAGNIRSQENSSSDPDEFSGKINVNLSYLRDLFNLKKLNLSDISITNLSIKKISVALSEIEYTLSCFGSYHYIVGRSEKAFGENLDDAKDKFRTQLIYSFEEDPIEDGIAHEAESILNEVLEKYPDLAQDWIYSISQELLDSPGIAADLITCLGRIDINKIKIVCDNIAFEALKQPDIELREAAVCAIEHWRKGEFIKLLKYYIPNEKDLWLKDYAERVLRNLRK